MVEETSNTARGMLAEWVRTARRGLSETASAGTIEA